MNEKTLRALVEAGVVKRLKIIADGATMHIEAETPTGKVVASTLKGDVKTWSTFDAAAKWVRALGMGVAQIDVARWQPEQKGLKI